MDQDLTQFAAEVRDLLAKQYGPDRVSPVQDAEEGVEIYVDDFVVTVGML